MAKLFFQTCPQAGPIIKEAYIPTDTTSAGWKAEPITFAPGTSDSVPEQGKCVL